MNGSRVRVNSAKDTIVTKMEATGKPLKALPKKEDKNNAFMYQKCIQQNGIYSVSMSTIYRVHTMQTITTL